MCISSGAGCAPGQFADTPVAAGTAVDDLARVDYPRDHLNAAHEVIARGVDLRGYLVWSLLDT